ncbi:MAG: transcription elongation factor GreB [Gammaproteobacteria bacterium]|nr:GreA/GreB family elongation factor [Gammaproteobacteria bacterium]NNC97506.1 transcription elongation factor GreB [Gammaproteobacteria bacterium]NNM14222.1 transcription elongation factor GreB [Gammaproteobacteria bacterium]
MGRYRPPQAMPSAYITPEGFAALEKEAKEIWIRRRDVVKALSEAAAEGDRSENAEYIYRKKELRGLDRRIRYLQKRMPDLTVVEARDDTSKIFFGAWVDLENEAGETVTYRIVGADEINPKLGYISLDSPMSKALLGKQLDDEISLEIQEKQLVYWVAGIRYK